MIRPSRSIDPWPLAAFSFALLVLSLVLFETLVWHRGYALGDEGDIVCALQRVREGMPFPWVLSNGAIHKTMTLGVMELFPGRLWATSAAGIMALAAEAFLLFKLGRRWGGSRAGFFVMTAGIGSAFTLIRARVGLSFCLFPAEWLFLFWLRPRGRKPWVALCWGGLLAGLCFDYEAWGPMALLLLLLPLEPDLTASQRGWELAGFAVVLGLLLPVDQLLAHLDRRKHASFMTSAPVSPGLQGLWQLLWNAPCEPYMAPAGHGVLPLWQVLVLPLGFLAWGRGAWKALLYLGLGLAFVLAGGAAYGLPAHRIIAAWPLLALLTGMGLERLWGRVAAPWARRSLLAVLALCLAGQALAWVQATQAMDIPSRSPIRDLQRAAQAAWQHSVELGVPLVTELHPLKGAQVRFLCGHALGLPDAAATTVVAYLPWDYLPALKRVQVEGASFKEAGNSAPEMVVVLHGASAQAVIETEREQRTLLVQAPFENLASAALEHRWLLAHPHAGAWARTYGLDYEGLTLEANYRLSVAWALGLAQEPLVSVRPLIVAIRAVAPSDPMQALAITLRAQRLDPLDARVRRLERGLLIRLGHQADADRLDQVVQQLYVQGHLLSEQ